MALEGVQNPNTQDLPEDEQVMSSPRAATAQAPRRGPEASMMNGAPGPLRGHQDIDGEVRTLPADPTSQSYVPSAHLSVQPGGTTAAQPALMTRSAGSGFLAGPEAQGATERPMMAGAQGVPQSGSMMIDPSSTEPRGLPAGQRPEPTGVLTGMIQAAQAIPSTLEGLVNRPSPPQSAAPSAGAHDSVEYASVRTSVPGSGVNQTIPSGGTAQGALFDQQALDRMQRMQDQAPLLYPVDSPVLMQPSSTTSSDLQAEVRRQLSDMMRLRDEESRRLRAQVEALSFENQSLRLRMEAGVQEEMHGSRPEGFGSFGFPSFGWLGRGLGSLIGPPRPPRGLGLASGHSPPRPPDERPLPPQVMDSPPRSGPVLTRGDVPPPPRQVPPSGPGVMGSLQTLQGVELSNAETPGVPPGTQLQDSLYAAAGTLKHLTNPNLVQGGPAPPPQPHDLVSSFPPEERPRVMLSPNAASPHATESAVPRPGAKPDVPKPPGIPVTPGLSGPTSREDTPASGLDPMSVVLTGMAQLQSVVNELASPKANEKPEVIKPGVLALPELPGHSQESCLAFADWLHVTKPALADVSDTSERLWELTIEEASSWYASYLRMGPLERLTAKPVSSAELSQPKWARVSRRIESMINAACPASVREEVSASRTSGLLPLICKLFVIYGPGSLTERELGLKHIADPPVCSNVQEAIDALRRWKRWCGRMTELGGVLPDSAIQVRALTKITKTVLSQHPEAAFRINLTRAELQVDLVPDSAKVAKLHAQMLRELESMVHRGDKERDKPQRDPPPQPLAPPKVKGVEAPNVPEPPQGGRPERVPKSGPKGPPPPKPADQGTSGAHKIPCNFYTGANGCKKGSECTFEHNWGAFSAAEKAARCKTCGSKSHKSNECKAGGRMDEKPKPKGPRQGSGPKATPDGSRASQPSAQSGEAGQQQIKSMLADAARFLQQTIPPAPPAATEAGPPPTVFPIPSSPAQSQPKASAQATVQGTPVTLASLSAQLDHLRAMVGNPEIRTCRIDLLDKTHHLFLNMDENQGILRSLVDDCEAKVQKGCTVLPSISTALLDSGATHAVIPYSPHLSNLESVPVTLAGDAKDEWWRTQGGTLVVPPMQDGGQEAPKGQMILPLGALVETLGCQVSWSKRQGLKVTHPTLGLLRTGVSGNTCPYVQEGQALQLIAELEESRLSQLQEKVDTLQCRLEEVLAPPDPTEALKRCARTGDRREVLTALTSQPYIQGVSETVVASLAESFPAPADDDGRAMLKRLPLKRAARRALLTKPNWVIHLGSGRQRDTDPIASWCAERGMAFLPVDLLQKGGKGWDLTKPNAVWKVLLWAAASGRVAVVLSSMPGNCKGQRERLVLQDKFLWSLASAVRGSGIPFLAEVTKACPDVDLSFKSWSRTSTVTLSQGALGGLYERPITVLTNLDLAFLSTLSRKGATGLPPEGREWTTEFRKEIVQALRGRPTGNSVEELDRVISEGQRAPADSKWQLEAEALRRAFEEESEIESDEDDSLEADPLLHSHPEGEQSLLDSGVGKVERATVGSAPKSLGVEIGALNLEDKVSLEDIESGEPGAKNPKPLSADAERWRQHLLNGHVPYRRDCKQCVEGAGLGPYHRRIKYPRSFALSVDLFGPVPAAEAGRDEGCITGKNLLRYALVGAFRVPRSLVQPMSQVDGVKDLFPKDSKPALEEEGELAEYAPSEPSDELFPELFQGDLNPVLPEGSKAKLQGIQAQVDDGRDPNSLLTEEDLPEDAEGMNNLINSLREPVDQVVLRYCIPLRSKTGPEVTEALQHMILDINQRFPVKSLHHDPGTEFASTALSRWLAQHGVRVQHTLPTDKKGNGLSERTVGWIKSRIRTLLGSADLPVGWWPLAARWAVSKHNSLILGGPKMPSFGQKVLHRVKRPADGAKQLMERWIEARYAAPHRSIPEGHVLLTPAGNLVASKGFKSEVIDPTKVKELELPMLQEEEELSVEEEETLLHKQGNPPRRLKGKTAVRFVEPLEWATSEEFSRHYLLTQDYSIEAVRQVLCAVAQEEASTSDRRGIDQCRQVLGAYCRGGLRGVTNLTKKKLSTTKFLNFALMSRLISEPGTSRPSWSALMLMRAGDVDVHRDWRNEWGSMNYTMHIPGEVQLWVESGGEQPVRGSKLPTPTWKPTETQVLSELPCAFDPRCHHAVRMHPNWLMVGYTPLGTAKLNLRDKIVLESCGFPLVDPTSSPGPEYQVKALSATSEDTSDSSLSPEELQAQINEAIATGEATEFPAIPTPFTSPDPMQSDLQDDSVTAPIGWDFSTGDPGDRPLPALVHVALGRLPSGSWSWGCLFSPLSYRNRSPKRSSICLRGGPAGVWVYQAGCRGNHARHSSTWNPAPR